MEHIKREQDILHRLEESRKAVKYKYNILKRNKASINQILNDTFKPMTAPLEKLINLTENHNKKIEKKSTIERKANDDEASLLNTEANEEDILQTVGGRNNDNEFVEDIDGLSQTENSVSNVQKKKKKR